MPNTFPHFAPLVNSSSPFSSEIRQKFIHKTGSFTKNLGSSTPGTNFQFDAGDVCGNYLECYEK